jgi:hypothetical protein
VDQLVTQIGSEYATPAGNDGPQSAFRTEDQSSLPIARHQYAQATSSRHRHRSGSACPPAADEVQAAELAPARALAEVQEEIARLRPH